MPLVHILLPLIYLLVPPLLPRDVALDVDGSYAWAMVGPFDARIYGSANADTLRTTVESAVKPWIAADYLARNPRPGPWAADAMTRMIRDSDNRAAQAIYRTGGGDAVIRRMITRCGMVGTDVEPAWWSLTRTTAADLTRLGVCLRDGAAGTNTGWLLEQMRQVRGGVDDQQTETGGGRWGIIDGLPSHVAAATAIKNGWTRHGGEWRVNCLAIHPGFVLAVVVRYPARHGLRYGAAVCRDVTDQLVYRRPHHTHI